MAAMVTSSWMLTTRALRAYQAAWAMRQPATIAAATMAAARRGGGNKSRQPAQDDEGAGNY